MRLLVVSCAPVVSSFTLSLACLLLTAITVHNTCSHSESFPLHPLVVLRSAPSASVHHSVSKHTQTHTLCALMLRLRSCLCLFLHPLLLPALFRFFFFCQSVAQVFTSVMCEFWWNVASRSAGSNMSVESLNQYFLVVFLFLFHPFILFLVFNSVPSKNALPPLYIISPTYCAGTAVSRRYRGCFGQPRLVGYFCPYPRLPRLDSQFSQQRTTQPVYRWKRKKAGRWPQRFLLSAAQGPQWLNSK